ncbi:hypothetical protein [Romboutsia sp. 1001713B170207_170306_H8]|uniref:hypothetical protein n=1 Tax=Romboutsia sp. 1001713B170207_170306_H8 TaxID=2787112 RepID=UPI000822797F|nr:hypothetical protein [Romboutsia sp. 1001713B170207_170306_H8]SCH41282.1 Uncharacterised protein [uncultured Clostridium sp.]
MRSITFGELLEKLLYLSNQKKSALANALGYDDSYISKWINGKNLPTQKGISSICKSTSEFIVNSLTATSMQDILDYFEMGADIDNTNILKQYIEEYLKEAYMQTSQKSLPNVYKNTHCEDHYNGMIHINPRLRKKYLSKDLEAYITKVNKLDLIIYANLYKLNISDKMSIARMKYDLSKTEDHSTLKIRFLTGFSGDDKDIIFNTILLINLITLYPKMKFEIYNCNINSDSIISVIKNRIFHSAVYSGGDQCLFTTMSREKRIVDDMYYNLEEILKNKGKPLVNSISSTNLIKEKVYTQYIMGQDLRLLIGSMNEIFMPLDIFEEVCSSTFKNDKSVLEEVNNINIFLQNVTYQSKLKVLICESELKRYISSGELNFFNNRVKLTFEQREKHLKYIEKIILESSKVEVKLIESSLIDTFKENKNPTIYLSRSINILPKDIDNGVGDYEIINDTEFKGICDKFFDTIWNSDESSIISDKEEILERINKAIAYAKIVNKNYKN